MFQSLSSSGVSSQSRRLFLASQSPRRREILQQIGVPFELLSIEVAEQRGVNELPLAYVERLAWDKSQAGLFALGSSQEGMPEAVVLGADTIVISPDGDVLEKPKSKVEALAMLQALSGREHVVASAVCLSSSAYSRTCVSQTRVTFRELTAAECVDYWHSGEPQDKAGGYAIQGLGAVFVAAIQGSYSGVVGLPIEVLLPLLKEFKVLWWSTTKQASIPYE